MKVPELNNGYVRFGSIAEVHGHSSAAKMTSVFPYGLMPWPKHFYPKTFGRS